MAKSGKGTAAARALTGAERHQRAVERLSEARAQLAALEAGLADGAAQLEAQTAMEQSAAKDVAKAEGQADEAAADVVEARSTLLVVEGSEEEGAAQLRHAEAQQAHTTARQMLDEARATLATVRERSQSERVAVNARQEEAKAQRRDVTRLVQALDRSVAEAHQQAGQELVTTLLAQYRALDVAAEQALELAEQVQQARETHREAIKAQLADGGWNDLLGEALEMARPAVQIAAEAQQQAALAEAERTWQAEQAAQRQKEAARRRKEAEELRRRAAVKVTRMAQQLHLQGDALAEHFREYRVTPDEVEQALATIKLQDAAAHAEREAAAQRKHNHMAEQGTEIH